jgi:phosphoribosylanthranilate isomerase
VNELKENVTDVIARAELRGRPVYSAVQFHGEESGAYCSGWNLKVIKAFRLKQRSSLTALSDFPADFYLLDSWSSGYGGSGAVFPWEWADGLEAGRLILSGGLCVENVAAAIKRIHPFAVDVCTGVEARPGIKDYEKLKEFIIAAKSA